MYGQSEKAITRGEVSMSTLSKNPLAKMLTSVVQSSAKSLLSTGLKTQAKNLIKQYTRKTPQQIEQEIVADLGYLTTHYKLDKDQNILYRSSAIFFQEWLHNSPLMKDKILRDEEDGVMYYNQHSLTNQDKVAIINLFVKTTNAQTPALSSHFDAAVKLFEPIDYNGHKFKQEMAAWNANNPSVIDTWLEKCFGEALTTDPAYARMVFRYWIVGAANRILNPGCSHDGCLVLAGPSGVGKTQFFRQIAPPPFEHRTGEVYCDLKNANKFVEGLIGKSICNFDEMSILDYPKTIELFKQLLTSQFWDVRLAWRRNVQRFKARTSFAATTNRTHFLPDSNLSRRLWVIELNDARRMDFDYYNATKTALWQEAVWCALQGHNYIPSQTEQQQIETNNQKYLITS